MYIAYTSSRPSLPDEDDFLDEDIKIHMNLSENN